MRIDNNHNPVSSTAKPNQVDSVPAAQAHLGSSGHAATSIEVGRIEGLLQLIVSANEIRESLVQDARAKIQSGEYLTKAAAYQAAGDILNL